jgi:hypothetical protein
VRFLAVRAKAILFAFGIGIGYCYQVEVMVALIFCHTGGVQISSPVVRKAITLAVRGLSKN